MKKKASIWVEDRLAGWLSNDENGYHFVYDLKYVQQIGAKAVSLTLPIRKEPYSSKVLFPFFDGLIPEGWLLNVAQKNWKLNPRDRMGLLLACCADCIGNVSVIPVES
ncbi:phosphatidylinositol kinase [bacterium]|nr:phosphatidylinositol kinase [bacterium]